MDDSRKDKYRNFLWKVLESAKNDGDKFDISKESISLIEKLVLDGSGNEMRAVLTVASVLCALDVDLLAKIAHLSALLHPYIMLCNSKIEQAEEMRKK